MSGMKIDDHSFWAGKGGKESVFPKGVHTKEYSSAEGVDDIEDYPDTTEAIKKVQEMDKKIARGHAQKPGHRN